MTEAITEAVAAEAAPVVEKTASELLFDLKNEFLGASAQHMANMIVKYCPENDLRHAAIANLQMAFDFANKALQSILQPAAK